MPPKKLSKKEVEDKVINFLKMNERITRRDVANLCKLSEDQAYRILRRMKKKGKVVPKGLGRGTWYKLLENKV